MPEPVPLTLGERRRGKKYYYSYALFNALSYAVLAEALVILLVLRMGGGPVWVGAIGVTFFADEDDEAFRHRRDML